MQEQDNTTQPVPETPPVVVEAPQVPKNKLSPLVIGMSVLLILFLLITGFLAYQNMQLRSEVDALKATQVEETELSMNEPTPTEAPDPTADWETFEGNFLTFKYPGDYFVYSNQEYAADFVISDRDLAKQDSAEYFQMSIWVSSDTTAEESVANWQKELGGFKEEYIEFNGINAIKGLSGVKGEAVTTVWFEKNSELFTIILSASTDQNRPLFDQILSTFEFTE